MIRIASTLTSATAGLILAERVPVAFHEAGHAVVAAHLCESGISVGDWHGRLPDGPLLRYATITPRHTAKGQLYMGETKLTLRWRMMPEHLSWEQRLASGDEDDAALRLDAPANFDDASARLALARIAYLFGGRASEERLSAEILPGWWQAASHWWHELRERSNGASSVTTSEVAVPEATGTIASAATGELSATAGATSAARLARLMDRPGMAFGDLRKAQQIALGSVAVHAAAADAPEATRQRVTPPFLAAYSYTDGVLALRWPFVCALAGALVVRGTVDGAQAEALSRAHAAAARNPHADESGGERLLALVAPTPFLFGCLFALGVGSGWPARDRVRFAGPAAA